MRRSIALLLAFVLLAALLPRLETASEAAFYDEAIQKLIGWDVLRGYPDGSLHADSYITRAEFVALINRAYGYGDTAAIPFNDVPDTAWYHGDISAAYAAGYFTGTSPITAEPSGELTREQAMVLLARNMRLDEGTGEVTSFSDGRAFHSYSAGYANTAVTKGLVSGYSDGSFRPENSITRGEMAVMLSRALGNLVNSEGTYALGDVFGNVTINSPNVTLRNTTIAGDLYLTGGLGLGGVTLENVRVLGDIIVAGGGESDEGESVILRNVTADNILVDTLRGEYVSLRAEGDTNIGRALLKTDAYVQDRTASGLGFQIIRMEGEGKQYSLAGNLEKVVNAAPYSMLRVSQGTVQELTMDEAAVGASLWLDGTATVLNLTLDTATAVEGRGDIRKLNVNVAGTTTETLPDEIEIRPGLTGVIDGENMDSAAAAEASSEPRLLANYPRVINVAATSATATFSTNKSGTIYWAITSISDGSVNEEALLTPAARSSILKSGNLTAAQSNTVYSVNITGLTSGGNYYLSALLKDARGDYSPIKVASFTTTDNSVPAFGSGFPSMSRIEDTYADAAVMATKNCQLYWVVFDKGSSAPTAASFRAGAFSDAYGYGVMDVQRNISVTFPINNLKGLEELKSYDVYFWLNDSDSAKSSAVRKLSFTTVDRTPPRFNIEPTVTAIAATSLRLTTNLNETGTVYWVIVEDDADYPAQPTTAILDRYPLEERKEAFEDYFRLQIANGMNGLKAGSVKVKPNVDATINITGLTAETLYKIYFLAKDNAGNYSIITTERRTHPVTGDIYYELTSNFIRESTKDERPPEVRQEFTEGTAPRPHAETDILIVFNERVQYHDARNNYYKSLEELYNEYKSAPPAEAAQAEEEYLRIMRSVIQLCNSDGTPVNERNSEAHIDDDDWVIDYRFAEVSTRGKEMIVTFPTDMVNGEPTATSALNLNSDATYFFKINNIADSAATPNLLNGGNVVELERFTTKAAQVTLREANLTNITPSGGALTPIDLVYSMTPVSVSRADPSKSWDMLIWADRTVEFELYRAERLAGEGEPTADEQVWQKVIEDDAVISIPSGYGDDYKGLSYFRDILGYSENPYIRGGDDNEDGLIDDHVYYYAIKLKRIENKPASEWTGSVKFWITVDTGTSNAFRTVCQNLTVTTYDDALAANADPKLTEISVDFEGREDFIMTAAFRDTGAPAFQEGFPAIDAKDTYVTVELLLEREGTVYWVVAPADGSIPTRRLNAAEPYEKNGEAANATRIKDENGKEIRYEPNTSVSFADYDVPQGGNAYGDGASMVVFYDGDTPLNGIKKDADGNPVLDDDGNPVLEPDVWDWYPHELSAPGRYDITNPNYGAKAIAGNIEADASKSTTLEVTNLTANKEYFLYLVTMGKGMAASEYAQLYKFKTAEAYRPDVVVRRPDSENVSVTNQSGKGVNTEYALFLMSGLSGSELGKNFRDVLDTAKLAADRAKDETIPDFLSDAYKDYKVWQAIEEPSEGGESYFDRYATLNSKNEVLALITGASPTSANMGGTHGTPVLLTQNGTKAIYCIDEFPAAFGDPNNFNVYYFISASCYSSAGSLTGNSYTFHGRNPIQRLDNEPPKLLEISGDISVDYTTLVDGKPTVSGEITLLFDKALYYRAGENDRRPIHQSATPNDNYRSVTELITGALPDGVTIKTDENAANRTTDRIILQISHINDANIRLNSGVIASTSSSPIGGITTLRFHPRASDSGTVYGVRLESDEGNEQRDYNFSLPTGIWKDAETVEIYMNVISTAPAPQNVRVAMAQPIMKPGDSYLITATVLFDSTPGDHTVTWTSSDASVVVVVPDSTTYPSGGGALDSGDTSGKTVVHTARVYAVGPAQGTGQAKITASCGDKSGEITVTVIGATPTGNAAFTQSDYQVKIGETLDLKNEMNISPEEVRDLSIEWSSTNPSVASVSRFIEGNNEGGVVSGNTPGKATISAKITTEPGKQTTITATVNVTR